MRVDFFGEMGLFEANAQRTAEVRTRDVYVKLLRLPMKTFMNLRKQYPGLSLCGICTACTPS